MPDDAGRTEIGTNYERFEKKVKRISNVANAIDVLRWDQEVMMPDDGIVARSQQLSTLSSIAHEEFIDDEMATYLDALESVDLDADQTAVVREVRRQYDRKIRVPTHLVEVLSRTTSEAVPIWENAKNTDDFDSFSSTLETLVGLSQEYAAYIDSSADPYAVLFAEYEPYLDLDQVDDIITALKQELVPLIKRISDRTEEPTVDAFAGTFPVESQERLTRDALDLLGYDWKRGRLDTAPHPFSSGNQFDARVTTRFNEADLLGAILSTIHEFGHATYTVGLPDDAYGTPLGAARDLTVHESQSRLWENHIGRSRAFWEHFLSLVKNRFSFLSAVTVSDAYETVNRVYDDNLIRVEADELTYHMHIVLRYEIERELIHGDLDAVEVPTVWNDKMERYLGIRPPSDTEGCLQDIHWSHGSFGYFPTYTLGSVLAAQLYRTAESDIPDLTDRITAGRFDPLHDWLTDHVHRYGCRYTTPDLIEAATGESFTSDYFVEYVTEKYTRLYDL